MKSILIIEDESAYQKILKEAFEKEQFNVILASEAHEGINLINKAIPDLILLDIILPGGMNGFDFLEQIREGDKTKNIPVIIITNIATEEKVAKEIGISSYFVKSDISISEIVREVKELLT